MMDMRWFISYRVLSHGMPPRESLVVTDVTPARWVMYRKVATGDSCYILYAEEISPVLAAELMHTAKIEHNFFKEGD
jgi:hypothetical protein